ncbi:hypothetical protein COB87_002050 [Candidatus Wolfebacteria bacterium]|nr:hypothetical protein [Candidatus Wolfebacteria bacterium]
MTFKMFVTALIDFFNTAVIPLLMSLVLLIFMWGVVQYFFIKKEDPEARIEGAKFMMWGVIAFAVIVSMWGLVSLLLNSFGI